MMPLVASFPKAWAQSRGHPLVLWSPPLPKQRKKPTTWDAFNVGPGLLGAPSSAAARRKLGKDPGHLAQPLALRGKTPGDEPDRTAQPTFHRAT